MLSNREATARAKQRAAKLADLKSRHRYWAKEGEAKWQPTPESQQEEKKNKNSISWDSVDLLTGELRDIEPFDSKEYIPSEEHKETFNPAEDETKAKSEQSCDIADFYGLNGFTQALSQTKIPFEIQQSEHGCGLKVKKKKKLIISLSPSGRFEFQVEHLSTKPRVIKFSLRYPTDVSALPVPRMTATEHARAKQFNKTIPVRDNCLRECFIYCSAKELFLIHCGIYTFPMEAFIDIMSDFPITTLGVARSRIKNLNRNSVTIDVTCPGSVCLEIYQDIDGTLGSSRKSRCCGVDITHNSECAATTISNYRELFQSEINPNTKVQKNPLAFSKKIQKLATQYPALSKARRD